MSASSNSPARLLDELTQCDVTERARKLTEAGDVESRLSELIEHAARLTAVDAAKAIEATDVVVNLADRLGSQLDRARARRARSRALAYTGRFEDALRSSQEGIRLAEEAGSSIEAGRARLASMHALGELGRLDDAIRAGEEARSAFMQAGEPALAARADINLGGVYQRRDQPAIALECFDRAKPWLMDDALILGHLENNRGEALLGLNDFGSAEKAYNAALKAFTRAEANLTAAIAEGNLAELAARQGRLQKSLFHFERARRAFEIDNAPGHLARLRAEQAEAMNVLGLPCDAVTEYQAALPELDRCGLALESAKARAGLGTALVRLGRAADAETALAAAATAFEELGHRTARGKVDLIRAELAARNARISESRSLVLRALAAFHDRPAETIAARFLLGRLAMETGKLDQADAELGVALALAREFDVAPLLADVLHTRGTLRRQQNRLADAAADFAASIDHAERVRGALQAERFRAAYLGDRSATFEWLVVTMLDDVGDDHVARAFATAERAKSRSLIEQMRLALESNPHEAAKGASSSEEPLIEEIEHVRADLSALYSRLGDDAPYAGRDVAGANRNWRAAVTSCERRLDDLQSRLATTRGIGNLYAPTVTLAQVQSHLKPDHAFIEFFIAGDELLAFVVRRDHASVARRLGDLNELARRQQSLQFQINRALRPGALEGARAQRLVADARHELKQLHDMLIAPIEAELSGARRLTIVPHGSLHLLPFHALWDGQSHLIERFTLHLAPSASLLVHLLDRPGASALTREGSSALVVGVADQNAPQIADEARSVADAIQTEQCDLFVGDNVTVEQVSRAAPAADIIHLACHGVFSMDAPMGSGLKLGDRWMTVRDIYRLPLKAQLVTLSGCETGVNLVTAGDELMGLLRGFFAGGAASLLVSLWRVNDAVTREYMTDFYRSLNTIDGLTRTTSDIYAQTQREFLSRHQHPALWGPFVLEGRG